MLEEEPPRRLERDISHKSGVSFVLGSELVRVACVEGRTGRWIRGVQLEQSVEIFAGGVDARKVIGCNILAELIVRPVVEHHE